MTTRLRARVLPRCVLATVAALTVTPPVAGGLPPSLKLRRTAESVRNGPTGQHWLVGSQSDPTLAEAGQASGLAAQQPRAILERAVADFEVGRIAESAAGFDTLVKVQPSLAPGLWQRGITLYYAGRYADCRAQFELHRTVNPADVENAAWHFLCVARAESAAKARAALLPVGPDARRPMREIYEMFRGAMAPEGVLQAAGSQPAAQFYAQLYLGLYFEALRDDRRALEHIMTAAADRYADAGGYMHTVAKVHLGILKQRPSAAR